MSDESKNDKLAVVDKATAEIEKVLTACNAMTLRELPSLKQAVVLATGIQHLRRVMTVELVQQVFMPLQGSPLGFVTDKDKDGGYPPDQVRDCMIEAMIMGLRPIGNELNIISGRTYAAKNGLARQVREWPGMTDFRLTPGVATMVGSNGALVPIHASWRVNGIAEKLDLDVLKNLDGTMNDTRLMIRVNSGMGADAILGKAKRKAYAAILDILTGCKLSLNDGEIMDVVGEAVADGPAPAPAPPEQDGRRMDLGRRAASVSTPSDPPPAPPKSEPRTGSLTPPQPPPTDKPRRMRQPGEDD